MYKYMDSQPITAQIYMYFDHIYVKAQTRTQPSYKLVQPRSEFSSGLDQFTTSSFSFSSSNVPFFVKLMFTFDLTICVYRIKA